MPSKRKRNSLTFSWTSPKGLLTIGLFLSLASISEFFMVSFFVGSGLKEIPLSLFPVTPLFHIVPLAVILVLVSSWMYTTNYITTRPYRLSLPKISKSRRRHSRRRKPTRNLIGVVKKFFKKISSVLLRSSGVSEPQTLSFGKIAFESIVTVLTIFLLSIILLSVLVYPNLFTDFAVAFYSETSPLQSFMQSLAEGVISIAGGLDSIAPSFRNAFDEIVSARTSSLTGEDLLWRYIFCQNAAAWLSAISAFVYVKYFSSTHRKGK